MFDFFSNMDEGEAGEVEMISFGPYFDDEPENESEDVGQPEVVEEPQIQKSSDEQVAMSRTYIIDGITYEIAYINYNKVRITRGDATPEIKVFDSSKEAVDYYVEQMQMFESEDE